jgi:hypothetical protein
MPKIDDPRHLEVGYSGSKILLHLLPGENEISAPVSDESTHDRRAAIHLHQPSGDRDAIEREGYVTLGDIGHIDAYAA